MWDGCDWRERLYCSVEIQFLKAGKERSSSRVRPCGRFTVHGGKNEESRVNCVLVVFDIAALEIREAIPAVTG